MAKLPTSNDVARLAGVSQTTVSFVINRSRPVPDATACWLRRRNSATSRILVPER